MLIIYTGNGKGKTSACVGQAIRAVGQGFKVAFAQFMKRSDQAGEQKQLAALLGSRFFAGGRGFFRDEQDRAEQELAAAETLAWARSSLEDGPDMLIMDEALYALGSGLLKREDIEALAAEAAQCGCHLVLSGRGAPEWLVDAADLVTEMREIKHPWQKGVKAARGIEF